MSKRKQHPKMFKDLYVKMFYERSEYKLKQDEILGLWLENIKDKYKEKYSEEPNQNQIADIMGISANDFSKILHGKRNLYLEEVIKLSDELNMTYDEVITGIAPERKKARLQFGLSQKTQKNLELFVKEKPEYLELLNIILGDSEIANLFFRSILVYVCASMMKIVPLTDGADTKEFIYIDAMTGEHITEQLSAQVLFELLRHIKVKWELKRKSALKIPVARVIRNLHKGLDDQNRSLESPGVKRTFDETVRRLKLKKKAKAYKQFNVVKESEMIRKQLNEMQRRNQRYMKENYRIFKDVVAGIVYDPRNEKI